METPVRVGLIVPSSNTTMETEIPEMIGRREAATPERFTFHSSRMSMQEVSLEELAAMNADGDQCALELSDARCDVLAYACLVAVMCAGPGAHRDIEANLEKVAAENDGPAPVVTSAGALVDGVKALDAERVALIAPYAPALTDIVIKYLNDEGIEVVDFITLNVTDNVAVGRLDPAAPAELVKKLDLSRAQAVIASACVQMPSLASVQAIEDATGLPTLSSASATVFHVLEKLKLEPRIPGAGSLLARGL